MRWCVIYLFVGVTLPAGELVANGGFEEVKGGKPVQWTLGGISDGGRATFSASSDSPKSGKQ